MNWSDILPRIISFCGLIAMMGVALLLSVDRRKIRLKTVLWGIGLQLIFAVFILKTPVGVDIFRGISGVFKSLLDFIIRASEFLFGVLATDKNGVYGIAFAVLPSIIVMSSISAVLYHYGVLQKIVWFLAKIMQKTMGISGAESLSAASNIFVGMTEAPLLVRPYVKGMTRSELFCVMNAGMATIAGGVMLAYMFILRDAVPGIEGHLLTASVLSAPAAIALAKIMFPETGTPATLGSVKIHFERESVNGIDAAAHGAGQGLKLALNVAAMLIAFYALIYIVNALLGWAGGWFGEPNLSLQMILRYLFYPFAWVMGVPVADCGSVSVYLGEKVVLNEWIAYGHMAEEAGFLTERGKIIASYALCGFANFGSLGIMIAGIGGMAPTRRHDLARLGIKSIIGGTLAAFMTACIAGMLL